MNRTPSRFSPGRLAAGVLFLAGLQSALLAGAGAAQEHTAPPLSRDQQREVVERAASVLKDRYVFPEVADRLASGLVDAERRGLFVGASDPAAFASALTGLIREISHDGHLWVAADRGTYPEPVEQPDPAKTSAQRHALAAGNFGLPKVEVLPGNVGYLNIRQFVAPELAGDAAAAAMRFLANTDAVILDVGDSLGGSPGMVAFFASYLFEPAPVHLFDQYWRAGDRTDRFFTDASLAGPRLSSQPVHVLTRSRTFSAGEGLAYVLKHLGRATVVGERTAGGAHPGRFHRLSGEFVMFVAEARVTSPVTQGNWEGTGVHPHVEVAATDALDTAYLLLLGQLVASNPDAPMAAERRAIMQELRTRLDTAGQRRPDNGEDPSSGGPK